MAGAEGNAAAKGRLAHDCPQTLICASRFGSLIMAAEIDGNVPIQSDADIAMMRRCIHLSATSAQLGELPFAALLCKGGDIIAERTNRVVKAPILPITQSWLPFRRRRKS